MGRGDRTDADIRERMVLECGVTEDEYNCFLGGMAIG